MTWLLGGKGRKKVVLENKAQTPWRAWNSMTFPIGLKLNFVDFPCPSVHSRTLSFWAICSVLLLLLPLNGRLSSFRFLLMDNKYHVCNHFKQHPLMISLFLRSQVQVALLGSLFRASQGQNQPVGQGGLLSGGSRRESASGFLRAFGRVHVLVAAGLRSPFPDWPSAGGLIAPQIHPHSFFHPPSLKQQRHVKSSLCLSNRSDLFCCC